MSREGFELHIPLVGSYIFNLNGVKDDATKASKKCLKKKLVHSNGVGEEIEYKC